MTEEIDPTDWEECAAPTPVPDRWDCKWRVSPDAQQYHLIAERYFPGRGTWHQEVVIEAAFLQKAKDPGMAVSGFLHSMVPGVREQPGRRIVDPNLN